MSESIYPHNFESKEEELAFFEGQTNPQWTNHAKQVLSHHPPSAPSKPKSKPKIKALGVGAPGGKRSWIIDQFLAKGAVLLLAAEKGSAKTSFLMQAAFAMSQGTDDFLGELPCKKSRVLFIQADEPEADTEQKRRIMDLPEGAYEVIFWDQTLNLDWLKELLKEEQFDVVIIDSATKGLTEVNAEVQDAGFTRKLYKLSSLVSKAGVACIVTTHLNKPQDGRPRQTVSDPDIAGLSTIDNAIQDIWGLVRLPGTDDQFQLNCLGKRNCRLHTLWKLQGDETLLSFDLTEVGKGQDKPSVRRSLREKILLFLQTIEKADLGTIQKETGSTYKVVARYCTEMFAEGVIERTKGPTTGGRPPLFYFLP